MSTTTNFTWIKHEINILPLLLSQSMRDMIGSEQAFVYSVFSM